MRRFLPLLLFLVGCSFQPVTEPRRPDPATEPTIVPTAIAIEKPTYIVERGSVTSQLFKSGRVAPVRQNLLSFPISGQIASLLVSKGDSVNAGEVVAVLDTTGLEQAKREAEADLSLAQEQLAIARENQAADRRRAEIGVALIQLQLDFAVAQAGAEPTAEQDLAIGVLELQLELAELDLMAFDNAVDPALANEVAQSQQRLQSIERQIAQSTLRAPGTGTVMVINYAAGDSVVAGETILVVADLNSLEVQVGLLDRELDELSEGMVAFGTIPARPETRWPMTVRQLPYPYGTGAQNDETDSFVRIAFDDPAAITDLDIGDRIEIAILLESREDVLWLPPAAIREFNGRLFVVVQDGEAQQRLDIRIGLQNENQIEIMSGLAAGQLVVGP